MQIELMVQNAEKTSSPQYLDRAVLFGDGFFTTGIVKDHCFCFSEKHFDRLILSAERLRFSEFDISPLKEFLHKLLPTLADSAIRISISRQQIRRGYAIDRAGKYRCRVHISTLSPAPSKPCQLVDSSVFVSCNPSLAGIKHLNRLDSVLAASAISSDQEAIMYFRDQAICGSRSNLFLLLDGQWHTPDLSECGICGITRQRVIETFDKLQISYKIGKLERCDLLPAESAFVCNSLLGIWPVESINGRSLDLTGSDKVKQLVPRIST